MWLLHWLLDLDCDLSKFILFSLANYNGSISKRGKYLFLEGRAQFHITYSSSLLQDLFNNFFIGSSENNYPWRAWKKKIFSPCTLPSGTELLSFRDALPDIATHKTPAFHLVLWHSWILPKSLTQQCFFLSASHCKFISNLKVFSHLRSLSITLHFRLFLLSSLCYSTLIIFSLVGLACNFLV